MHDALTDMLAMEVVIGWNVDLPSLQTGASMSSSDLDQDLFATVKPCDACIVTIVQAAIKTPLPATYIAHTDNIAVRIFKAKLPYQLNQLIPPDSIVMGFAYRDKQNVSKLGLFDCVRMNGQNVYALPPMKRHVMLHECWFGLEQKSRLDSLPQLLEAFSHVSVHWCGELRSCVAIKQQEVPFYYENFMLIPDELQENKPTHFKVIKPIDCE